LISCADVAEEHRNRLHRAHRQSGVHAQPGQVPAGRGVANPAGQESSEPAAGVHIRIGDREGVPVGLRHPEQAAGSTYPAHRPDRRGRIAHVLQAPVATSPIDAAAGQRQLVVSPTQHRMVSRVADRRQASPIIRGCRSTPITMPCRPTPAADAPRSVPGPQPMSTASWPARSCSAVGSRCWYSTPAGVAAAASMSATASGTPMTQ
jgi:hypothetical protein